MMKKPYRKPILLMESFTLAEHIASGCIVISGTNYSNGDSCVYNTAGTILFSGKNSSCQPLGDILPDYEEYGYSTIEDYLKGECYGNFNSALGAFSS